MVPIFGPPCTAGRDNVLQHRWYLWTFRVVLVTGVLTSTRRVSLAGVSVLLASMRRTQSAVGTKLYYTILLLSGVTRGWGGRPRVTPSRGWHPKETIFLWTNLQRIVEKRGRTSIKGVGWHPRRGVTLERKQ